MDRLTEEKIAIESKWNMCCDRIKTGISSLLSQQITADSGLAVMRITSYEPGFTNPLPGSLRLPALSLGGRG